MVNTLNFNCPICKWPLEKLYCCHCGKTFGKLDGIPILLTSDNDLISKWNSVAHNFDNHYKISENVMDVDPRTLKVVRYLKTTSKSAVILDVGCGAGHLLRLLQNMGFTNLTGTEISPDRLKIAAEHESNLQKHLNTNSSLLDVVKSDYNKNKDITPVAVMASTKSDYNKDNKEHSTGIKYVAADTLNVFPDTSISVITAAGVIEHLEHPEEFYKECFRVLKPEGKLIVTSDCYLFRLQKWLGFYKTVQPIDNAPYPTDVIKTAERYGFKVMHFDAWGSWWFHIYLAGTNFISNITPKFVRKPFIGLYEKGLRTATKHSEAQTEFQLEDAPEMISMFATLKCICLIGDVFYFKVNK